MGKKFIPNGDQDFAVMAENFARNLTAEPARFGATPDDCEQLGEAVRAFRAALTACCGGGRSQALTRAKDDARLDAERIIRRLAHVVRSNPRIDAATKLTLSIRPRAEKAKQLPCPQEPPRLRFERALHEGNGATPVHELTFHGLDGAAKPAGAVRLELFVDLVPPDEEIPEHPGANHASRPWYLRSYTRSPIRLTPPMARVQMRVVYWARWADSAGNVGPFSATAVGWLEGGTHALLPGGVGLSLRMINGPKPTQMLEDATPTATGPATREPSYSVAVLEVRYQPMGANEIAAALPWPAEHSGTRQLEGPAAVNEAA